MNPTEKKHLKKIGEIIVCYREQKSLKQYELSDLLDIDVRVLRRIEKGETDIKFILLSKILKTLAIECKELFDFDIESTFEDNNIS